VAAGPILDLERDAPSVDEVDKSVNPNIPASPERTDPELLLVCQEEVEDRDQGCFSLAEREALEDEAWA